MLTLAAGGCSVHLGIHSGTHVDAPAHVVPGGRTIDGIEPEELAGNAAVIHLPELVPGQRISTAMPEEAYGRGADDLPRIVLLATSWDLQWSSDICLRHPVLTGEAASCLISGGMHVLGTDTASSDGHDDDALPAYGILLGEGTVHRSGQSRGRRSIAYVGTFPDGTEEGEVVSLFRCEPLFFRVLVEFLEIPDNWRDISMIGNC